VKVQLKKRPLLILLCCATIACAWLGFSGGFVHAQQATYLPLETPPKEHPDNTGKFAPLDWKPGTEHPGQQLFINTCQACHNLTEKQKIGPGLLGISERVPERSRLLKFITEPKSTDGDEYFKALRGKFADAMLPQGQAAVGDTKGPYTEKQLLDIIDFIFRFKAEFGPPPEERIKEGRAYASGAKRFENGAPGCDGCHSIGADKNLRGASVGPNIAHTWVLARNADGLKAMLENPAGPAMHHFYRADQKPLNGEELDMLITFFERAARDTGTETQSNFLPIFALILAALGIFVLDGSIFGKLFVHEEHEYVDGPYTAEEHH
jgi:cytochrome c2